MSGYGTRAGDVTVAKSAAPAGMSMVQAKDRVAAGPSDPTVQVTVPGPRVPRGTEVTYVAFGSTVPTTTTAVAASAPRFVTVALRTMRSPGSTSVAPAARDS